MVEQILWRYGTKNRVLRIIVRPTLILAKPLMPRKPKPLINSPTVPQVVVGELGVWSREHSVILVLQGVNNHQK